jgi:hypothetical protein
MLCAAKVRTLFDRRGTVGGSSCPLLGARRSMHFGELHASAPHLVVGNIASMDRAIAVRAERLDVSTPEGRGKGRIKARAGALALSGTSTGLQLSQASKCACDSGYVATVYIAAQASPGRLTVRVHSCVSGQPRLKQLQSSALQRGWTADLCPISRCDCATEHLRKHRALPLENLSSAGYRRATRSRRLRPGRPCAEAPLLCCATRRWSLSCLSAGRCHTW